MKKQLVNRIENYCDKSEFPFSVYFSEFVNDARYSSYKYFFKYHSTNAVAKAFKTQKEIEYFLDDNNF